MAEIKRFFDCFVPVSSCNLRCNYCYVAQHPLREEKNRFLYTAEEIGSALARKRFGGICCFNLCGSGETLYPSATIAIVRSILQEGHFVNIITNGTMTGRLREFLTFPEAWKQHLFIKFSYHYLELRDRHLTEIFFRNFNLLRENGISVSLEITADDNYVPHIPAIQQEALEHAGALPHVSIPRIETKKIPLENIFADPEEEIRFRAVGHHCAMPHCYNSHAFLTFGVIPNQTHLTYADMRNRKTTNGEWLGPEMKQFFSSKLQNSNPLFPFWRKFWCDLNGAWNRMDSEILRKLRNLIFLIRKKDWKGIKQRLQQSLSFGKTHTLFGKEHNNHGL